MPEPLRSAELNGPHLRNPTLKFMEETTADSEVFFEDSPLVTKDDEVQLDESSFTVGRFLLILAVMVCYNSAFLVSVPFIQQYTYFRFLRTRLPNVTAVDQDLSSPCLRNRTDNSTDSIVQETQSETSTFILYMTLGVSVFGTATTLFLGSYSDMLGRRVILLAILTCSFVKAVLVVLVAALELNTYLILVGVLIESAGGSLFGAYLVGYAYISDLSRGKSRTMFIAAVEGTTGLTSCLAQLVMGFAIQGLGFVYPAVGIASLVAISLVLCLFLPETVDTSKKSPKNHLAPWKVLGRFCSYCKPSPANLKYSLGLAIIFLSTTTTAGRIILEPLYQMNEPFCWDSQKIGLYSAISTASQNVVGIFSIKLLLRCFSECSISLIGLASNFLSFIVEGFAGLDWQMYIVPVVGILGWTPSPCLRAIISRMAPHEDLGTIFSGVAAVEMMTPAVSALLSLVYKATLSIFPPAIFFCMAACVAIAALLMGCLTVKLKS